MAQKKIVPNQEFKHEKRHYRKGRSYEIESDLAKYFIENGWADHAGAKKAGQKVGKNSATLEVQNGQLGQKAEV